MHCFKFMNLFSSPLQCMYRRHINFSVKRCEQMTLSSAMNKKFSTCACTLFSLRIRAVCAEVSYNEHATPNLAELQGSACQMMNNERNVVVIVGPREECAAQKAPCATPGRDKIQLSRIGVLRSESSAVTLSKK